MCVYNVNAVTLFFIDVAKSWLSYTVISPAEKELSTSLQNNDI